MFHVDFIIITWMTPDKVRNVKTFLVSLLPVDWSFCSSQLVMLYFNITWSTTANLSTVDVNLCFCSLYSCCVLSTSFLNLIIHNFPVSPVYWASQLLRVMSAISSSSATSTLSFVCVNWTLVVVCGRVTVHVEWLASSFLSWNHLELWRWFSALSPPCTSSQVRSIGYTHLPPLLFRRKISTAPTCYLIQKWSPVECLASRLVSLVSF